MVELLQMALSGAILAALVTAELAEAALVEALAVVLVVEAPVVVPAEEDLEVAQVVD